MKIDQLLKAIEALCAAGLANPETKVEAIVAVGESLHVRVKDGERFILRVVSSFPSGRCGHCHNILTEKEMATSGIYCDRCKPMFE